MKIKGTVTRVIEKNEATSETSRVFFRPTDAADAAKLDGSKRVGSGEIPVDVAADDLSGYKVGDDVEFDV